MAEQLIETSEPTDDLRGERAASRQAPYLLFILLVSLLALVVLAADVFVDDNTDTGRVLHYADTVLCLLFFADFAYCFAKAKDKAKYFATWGWLDLLSSIPAIDVLRWGRAARVARVLRVLRGVRSARILMRFILERRAQSAALAAAFSSIVVIAASSILVLHSESGAGAEANIRSAEDAIWWSIVTLTTVGYGDRYPVTTEGRLIAVVLMMAGVAVIGTWAGIAASWFMTTGQEHQDDRLAALRSEIRELRRLIEQSPR